MEVQRSGESRLKLPSQEETELGLELGILQS